MGTRNLTCVVLGGEYRVAQYCQWDGYPEGQGATVLNFLKNKIDLERFESALKETKWVTPETLKALWEGFGADDSGMVSMDISAAFKEVHPQLDRDMGANVLEFIQESDCPVVLNNEIEFAKDGLFCEWAYVIDLDNNALEVYSGFGKEKLPEDSRFGNDIDENGYSTIGLVKTYSLDDLPDLVSFVKELTPSDDEDEDDTMTKAAVYDVIDKMRNSDHGNDLVTDRICNFMEQMVDEFVEAYEE